jgi:3-methyl-2-oxobutanoate hydroxymethyltransferase
VLEAIPAPVAAHITRSVRIPTIGIGSGASCDGQVLVWHDLLGLTSGRVPRFVKQYVDLGSTIQSALEAYVADVRAGNFPAAQHTYAMAEEEMDLFESEIEESSKVSD